MAHANDNIDETLILKPCEDCGILFPALYLQDHKPVCPALIEDDVDESLLLKPCNGCGVSFPGLYLAEHQPMCPGRESSTNSDTKVEKKSDDAAEENQTVYSAQALSDSSGDKAVRKNNVAEGSQANSNPARNNDYIDADLLVEIACNVCGLLFPKLGMGEHQALCKKLNSPAKEKLAADKKPQKTKSIVSEGKTSKEKRSGKTFIHFVNDVEFPKDFENEKQNSSEVPSNPLFQYADQNDEEEDTSISDDDCGESLEDFWIRAQEHLKRRRLQNV